MIPRILPLLVLLAPLAPAQEAATRVAVRQGDFRVTFDRPGVYLPADAARLSLDPRAYRGDLIVADVVAPGAYVNKGDVVLQVRPDALQDQIAASQLDAKQAGEHLAHVREEAALLAKKQGLDLEQAKVDLQRAQTKLDAYRKVEKAQQDEAERQSVQAQQDRIDDAKDELAQLEKMYRQDELVDATEEIVLKRQRRNLARLQARFDLGQAQRAHRKKTYDPWKEQDLVRDVAQKTEALEAVQKSQAIQKEQKALELERAKFDLDRKQENLKELQGDLGSLTMRAPMAGIVIHGDCTSAPYGSRIEVGDGLRPRHVILCIATPGRLLVRTEIPESRVLQLSPETPAVVSPVALPGWSERGRLEIDALPSRKGPDGEGLFAARIALKKVDPRLKPGFDAKVTLVVEEERHALLIPSGAVRYADGKAYVECSKSKDGPVERRAVEVGPSDGTDTEVKDGLSAGEYVVVKKAS